VPIQSIIFQTVVLHVYNLIYVCTQLIRNFSCVVRTTFHCMRTGASPYAR